MAEKWEKQLKEFIKRTSDELKRTGDELKVEAQRLLEEVRDPARQAKVKDALKDLREKATAMTKDAADKLEVAVRKVEDAVDTAFDRNKADESAQAKPATPATPAAEEPAPASKPGRKTGKTIGKKAGAAKKAAGAAKSPAGKKAPKSIGRKKPSA